MTSWVRRILTCNWFLIVAALVAVGASLVASVLTVQWCWLARSGAIAALIGGILAARKLIRLGGNGYLEDQNTIDGGHFVPTADEREKERQDALDIAALKYGVVLVVLGTLLWAYG